MKTKFIYLFLLVGLNVSAQELRDLEKEISKIIISDTSEIRKKADQIFKIDPFNESATYLLIESYRSTNNESGIQEFFQKRKSFQPNNPLPYLLSAKYEYPTFSIKDTSRLTQLKQAFQLDRHNYEVNLLLGESYYQLFNETIVLDPTANPGFYASQSCFYLAETIKVDSSSLSSLKYPIIQLSRFLGKPETAVIFKQMKINPIVTEENVPDKGQFYFPASNFVDLPNGWDSDYKVDVVRAVNLANFLLEWFTYQLHAFKEPIIFNRPSDTIYRFTWLRSFHQPVVIRIQKAKGEILLSWKMADGAGGYNPGNVIVSEEKIISEANWVEFQRLMTDANFWSLPTNEVTNLIGDDGSEWIIEGIENGEYNVVNRWTPRKTDFWEIGNYLISLTNLIIPKEEFY